MMRHINLWIIIITILFVTGCKDNNDSFSPYTDLETDYSLYGVIDNRNEINLLRVQRIYTKENPVVLSGKTTATMTDQKGREIQLKDTLISGLNMYNFIIPANSLERGMNYRITVNNDELGLRWGYFRVFSNPDLLYQEYLIGSAIVDKWQLNIKFIKNSDAAFFCRLFIKYELLDDGIWKPGIKQIPIYMRIDPILYRDTWYLVDYNFEDLDVLYPSIENPDNLSDYVSLADGKYSILYDGWFTYQALKSIGKNRPPSSVKITGMYAVLNQIDKNYYYNFMANSRANKSVRLDEQLLLSNIKKEGGSGTGFIGSVTTDTLFYNVWYYYVKKLFYIDGQKYSKQ